ncbi:MAG: 5'-methylthioadenosine/adenosylhomocysteine nucleosidase [Neisseria sp.]|nr:5'-methylthioadenosine/adenosylhomocysteine nucleosidase [Neisseria sp.]
MNALKTIAVIGAMQPEIELLQGRLKNRVSHRFGAFQIDEGELHGKRVVLSLSGIGKVNAAVATALAVNRFAPDCVINTGSAGGLGKGLKVGDVVIGTQTAHHDVDVTAFGYAVGQVPQLPAAFVSDEHLVAAAERAAAAFNGANVSRGLIASGDQFVHSSEKTAEIRAHFPDIQAVEMEAAAIAQACAQLGVPFVVIRAISDSADEKADVSFDEFLQTAGKHSAQMVDDLIACL